MELWYTEKQTPNMGITCKIKRTLAVEKTDYQHLAVIDTEQFGTMLVLDGAVQTTVEDEFIYHEMITHIPLFTHKNPRKVLVIGGGDGGAIREILKHESVEKAYLVEIDGRVVENSKLYLPQISCALSDPRCEVLIEDGIEFIKNNKGVFDVIMVDSTDPVGPAVGLFSGDFYRLVYESLKVDGLFVAQTESPFFNKDLIRQTNKDINAIFPITRLYLASIPTYPSGLWSFTMGSKTYDPLLVNESKLHEIADTKYFTPEIFGAAFKLPRFVRDLVV